MSGEPGSYGFRLITFAVRLSPFSLSDTTERLTCGLSVWSFPYCWSCTFTFKTSTDRVADANHHVEELNTLYLSTIETLAMAIDAKDQITHGHIRRV